jgi:hypothetical protein
MIRMEEDQKRKGGEDEGQQRDAGGRELERDETSGAKQWLEGEQDPMNVGHCVARMCGPED